MDTSSYWPPHKIQKESTLLNLNLSSVGPLIIECTLNELVFAVESVQHMNQIKFATPCSKASRWTCKKWELQQDLCKVNTSTFSVWLTSHVIPSHEQGTWVRSIISATRSSSAGKKTNFVMNPIYCIIINTTCDTSLLNTKHSVQANI